MGNNQSEREYEEIRLKQTISLAEEQLKQAKEAADKKACTTLKLEGFEEISKKIIRLIDLLEEAEQLTEELMDAKIKIEP